MALLSVRFFAHSTPYNGGKAENASGYKPGSSLGGWKSVFSIWNLFSQELIPHIASGKPRTGECCTVSSLRLRAVPSYSFGQLRALPHPSPISLTVAARTFEFYFNNGTIDYLNYAVA